MKTLDLIEKKFGFTLPQSYRDIAKSIDLDDMFELGDGYMMQPQEIADFEWEDFQSPVEGLVPFACNGGGDQYCWYLPDTGDDGEPAVVEATHDSYIGQYYAPSALGTVFRNLLDFCNMAAGEEEAQEDLEEILPPILDLLKAHAPARWVQTIENLSDMPAKDDEFGNPCLYTEAEYDALITDLFGEKYIQNFKWDLGDD